MATGTRGGLFTNWDDLVLSLANEPSEDRPWVGELYLVAIYDRALEQTEVAANFQAGPATDPPSPVAPTIDTDPSDETVLEGQSATFSVVASGTPLLTFQWGRDAVAIPGETSASLCNACNLCVEACPETALTLVSVV